MSLQYVVGRSGSGKSRHICEWVLAEAEANPGKNYLYLVPEQFTMQTQRDLVELQENNVIMNVDVLSFARLAYRVFDELGRQDVTVLDETGKNLILRKLAAEQREKLSVLGGNIRKMGYIGEIKSLISEFSQYNVTPRELGEFLERGDIKETLRLKLKDVLTMYEAYERYVEGRYITSEGVLPLLCGLAERSALIRGSVLVFDGFTGFTPSQNDVLRRLMPLADRVVVSVTMDEREDLYDGRGWQDLFAMSKKMLRSLRRIAEETGTEILAPVVMEDKGKGRHRSAPQLAFLEKSLFRRKWTGWKEEGDEISVTLLKNPKEELAFAAEKIASLVRNGGYLYRDIAVVSGNVSMYSGYAKEVFGRYHIPFFVDQTKKILFHPLTELVRAAIEAVETDFSYESMFRLLRTGLMRIEESQIDRLENFCLATGIRGRKKWGSDWTFVYQDSSFDKMAELNGARGQIDALLAPLAEVFHDKNANVREMTAALYHFLVSLEIQAQMKRKEIAFRESGDEVRAAEYAQIYRIVIDLFDKVVSLLGEERMSLREYSDILDAGFDAAKVAVIPPGNDTVTIGDIERTRLKDIKVLFFLGVNDGVIPKKEGSGGILSQQERERMAECDMELSPGAREKVFIQKFYLYLNMTKPSEQLYVTFARVDGKGAAMRQSYLIGTLCRLFPSIKIREAESHVAAEGVITPEGGKEFFLKGLHAFLQKGQREPDSRETGSGEKGEPDSGKTEEKIFKEKEWLALASWYLGQDGYRDEVAKLFGAAWFTHTDEPISRAVAKAVYGESPVSSVTRLEKYAQCAYAHFLDYGLRLRERREAGLAEADVGTIYHNALEAYAKELEREGKSWTEVTDEERESYIDKSMGYAVLACRNAVALESGKSWHQLERMRATVSCAVWALTEQLARGSFVPTGYEVEFRRMWEMEPGKESAGGDQIEIVGRIDRVDTWENEGKLYVKIVDYKSGNTDFSLLKFYHGLQLQLVVYMDAALKMAEEKRGGNGQVEPAGIFYCHIAQPLLEGTGEESDEELREKLLGQMKLKGMANSSEEIYRAMDRNFSGSSSVIPVGVKRDGGLTAASKAASTEEFLMMRGYLEKKVRRVGESVFAGDIAARPYRLRDRTGCDYCSYRSICGFDGRIEGFRYNNLQDIKSADDVLCLIEKEMKEGGE